jgi:GAF domain-containing protein
MLHGELTRGLAVASGRLSRALESAAVIGGADGAALMLLADAERLRAIGASTPEGLELEVAQQAAGAGPAFDCLARGEPVVIEDLAASESQEQRVFAGQAAPIRSVLSLPVRVHGRPAGSLNLYRYRPAFWSDTQVAAAQRLSDVVAVLVEMLACRYGGSPRPGGSSAR